MGTTGVADLFYLLESNKLVEVEEIKKVFYDHFLSTKDNWLVTGLFDYYLSTNSLRVIEVLTSVREPHDKHLLDRLTETIICKPTDRDQRMKVIMFLGHIVRRQPTWLYKLANHSLFKELLKILKLDADILLLMSALLLLVMLLPILPAALGPFLQEIFEIFGRLSTYHYQQSSMYSPSTSNNLSKEHLYLLHFQVGLYGLFHRLYAMYPCNFMTYLKQQYTQKEQLSTFVNSVRPMLDSVRMHPNLVTSSKDLEISTTRWKKMEHHDIMAECGRFTLDKCREEISSFIDRSITPVNNIVCTPQQGGGETYEIENDGGGIFWSPSMMVSPNSPPSREPRSAPLTPNNNNNSVSNGNNSGTSPPEAAVEATPETTPVKDLRKIITRPINSTAVRALNVLGTSRPSTPTIIENKINKLVIDRQHVQPREDFDFSHNGKIETSWQEDQEVLEIVSGSKGGSDVDEFGHRVYRLWVNSRFGKEEKENEKRSKGKLVHRIGKSKSCPVLNDVETAYRTSHGTETSTQTEDSSMFPYEFLLLNVMDKTHEDDKIERLSPTSMLDRYVEACARTTNKMKTTTTTIRRNKQKAKKNHDETVNDESGVTGENGTIGGEIDTGGRNYSLELMLLQLQFERQRREVYAERNRRLIGKLRDSRALEELNLALNDRLRLMEKELEQLKLELDRNKKELYDTKEQYKETVSRWQHKCAEEEEKNRVLRDCRENLELQLKREEEKMKEVEKQNRSTEAAFFDAAHRLRGALKAANRGKELECILNNVQKKFLLLGEVQAKSKENSNNVGIGSSQSVGKAESSNVQKCYLEEMNNLKRQFESKTSSLEAFRTRLTEMESKEQRRETQTIELQRTLQEMKAKHEAELKSFESKYQAQVEINTLLEGRILELNGQLELATISMASGSGSGGTIEPIKERSPTLSVSLASSSEGSLAFIQSINPVSGSGSIMNEYCDNVVEISNLQAIVDDH